MSDFKRELKYFNIELDHVKEIDAFNDELHEAISKFLEEKILRENLEVVLNENLIEVRNKSNQLQAILGCKISLQQMDENISFVVKHCLKNTIKDADEMFEELGYDIKKPSFLFSACVTEMYEKQFAKETKYIYFMKDNSVRCNFEITIEELKAINKKCEELGWL